MEHASPVDKWVKEIIAELRQISRLRWAVTGVVVVLGILFIPTIAEFIVALHNRYRVYPPNFDTNMLAKSIGLSGVLSLGAAFLVGYILRVVRSRWYVVLLFLFLSGLGCMIDTGPWLWLGIPTAIIFFITIGLSFYARIPFLIPVLGFIIMLLGRPSMLPTDWCKYELTMYRCADQLDPAMNIKQ